MTVRAEEEGWDEEEEEGDVDNAGASPVGEEETEEDRDAAGGGSDIGEDGGGLHVCLETEKEWQSGERGGNEEEEWSGADGEEEEEEREGLREEDSS